MIETIRKTRDNHRVFAAVMTNASKAFVCISHKLLIAKLKAYGFDETALKVINSYLKNRTQTTKVGSSISALLNIIYGLPQYMVFYLLYVLMIFLL